MLLHLAHPPVNVLTLALREALALELRAAAAEESLRAVVIAGDGAGFSAGSDLAEISQEGLTLAALCKQIEDLGKPVVAALHGKALGGGLELALAAHLRVAQAGAKLGLPDLVLGRVPQAGGGQRLARLVGAEPALRLLLELAPITAAQALTVGLVDEVVETGLVEAAVAMAEMLAAQSATAGLTPASERQEGLRDGRGFHAAVAAARGRLQGSALIAPLRAVDCIEAAQLLSPEQGLAYEAAAYAELVTGSEAQGLRHAYFAERRAATPPAEVARLRVGVLTSLAIWGAGEGVDVLAVQALAAGLRVTVVDTSQEDLTACLNRIASRQAQAVSEARQSEAARDADWARLKVSVSPEALAEADLILATIDAGPLPGTPAGVVMLGALPARAGAGKLALLPAASPGLMAEVSTSAGAEPALVAKVLSFARRLGWRVIFSGPGGPIDKRLRAALSAAVAQLEAQGVAREVIVASLGSFGIGLGARTALPAAPPAAPGVLRACLAALANQGARLLSEGVARRPSDIDAAAIQAGLFPRRQGGPMYQADQIGLLVLRADLHKLAVAAPQIYQPDPLFDRLIGEGRSFAALDRSA